MIADVLERLACGRDLEAAQAEAVFDALMAGELTQAQTGALLMGLRAKGETAAEMAAGVKAALKVAVAVDLPPPVGGGPRIDTCGTGGDGRSSFNCSTAVALTLAGMGYEVVKHGNRAVSSSCGSADVVEALGLPLAATPEDVRAGLARGGFAFLMAPHFHPGFKHVVPVRRELGTPTVFNLMGPLLNPARPQRQLVGVARPEYLHRVAEALLLTGVERAAVVHGRVEGEQGFDELTPFGVNRIVWVAEGKLVETELDPEAFGLGGGAAPVVPEDVAVADKDEALAAIRQVLAGEGGVRRLKAMRDMTVLNLAVCLQLLDEEAGLAQCVERAAAALAAGVGLKVLETSP